jgi:hypothetical protein
VFLCFNVFQGYRDKRVVALDARNYSIFFLIFFQGYRDKRVVVLDARNY